MGKNNLAIDTLQDKINELTKAMEALKKESRLLPAGLKIGDTFNLATIEWKILGKTNDGYFCIANSSIGDMKFDLCSNDWSKSKLREYLNNDLLEKIKDEIGGGNILPLGRNLLSLDGIDEYEDTVELISLLTVDEYRKYRKLLPNTGEWWWTITPWSTKSNGYESRVAVVASGGYISGDGCRYDFGVRPVCILKSEIFES